MLDKDTYLTILSILLIIVAVVIANYFLMKKEGFDVSYNGVEYEITAVDSSSSDCSGSSTSTYGANYNHYTGTSSQLQTGATYYGPNGGTATVVTGSNGSQILQITYGTGQTAVVYVGSVTTTTASGPNGSAIKFTGPNGETAIVAEGSGGGHAILVSNPNAGWTYTYSSQQPDTSSGSSSSSSGSSSSNSGSYASPSQYSSVLPPGIPYNQIPPGQQDLYILKSEVIPPVCPTYNYASTDPNNLKCPPCPACARCPEPSMTCKAVPNYASISDQELPAPAMTDFSGFGL